METHDSFAVPEATIEVDARYLITELLTSGTTTYLSEQTTGKPIDCDGFRRKPLSRCRLNR